MCTTAANQVLPQVHLNSMAFVHESQELILGTLICNTLKTHMLFMLSPKNTF